MELAKRPALHLSVSLRKRVLRLEKSRRRYS